MLPRSRSGAPHRAGSVVVGAVEDRVGLRRPEPPQTVQLAAHGPGLFRGQLFRRLVLALGPDHRIEQPQRVVVYRLGTRPDPQMIVVGADGDILMLERGSLPRRMATTLRAGAAGVAVNMIRPSSGLPLCRP